MKFLFAKTLERLISLVLRGAACGRTALQNKNGQVALAEAAGGIFARIKTYDLQEKNLDFGLGFLV